MNSYSSALANRPKTISVFNHTTALTDLPYTTVEPSDTQLSSLPSSESGTLHAFDSYANLSASTVVGASTPSLSTHLVTVKTDSSLSTPFDKPRIPSDTALIIIGSEHTRLDHKQQKFSICTQDAIVITAQSQIFNIDVLKDVQRLTKNKRHVRIVLNDSSQAAQLLFHRISQFAA